MDTFDVIVTRRDFSEYTWGTYSSAKEAEEVAHNVMAQDGRKKAIRAWVRHACGERSQP